LIQLSDHYLPLPEAYFLAWNMGALDKPLGAAFRDWLTTEARQFEYAIASLP
jgi:LysR family transcriptional regulator, glycine cleavage system transcriptional activator